MAAPLKTWWWWWIGAGAALALAAAAGMGLWSALSGVTRTVATYGKRTTRVIMTAPPVEDRDDDAEAERREAEGGQDEDGGAARADAEAERAAAFERVFSEENDEEEEGQKGQENIAPVVVARAAKRPVADAVSPEPAQRSRADSFDSFRTCKSFSDDAGPAVVYAIGTTRDGRHAPVGVLTGADICRRSERTGTNDSSEPPATPRGGRCAWPLPWSVIEDRQLSTTRIGGRGRRGRGRRVLVGPLLHQAHADLHPGGAALEGRVRVASGGGAWSCRHARAAEGIGRHNAGPCPQQQ